VIVASNQVTVHAHRPFSRAATALRMGGICGSKHPVRDRISISGCDWTAHGLCQEAPGARMPWTWLLLLIGRDRSVAWRNDVGGIFAIHTRRHPLFPGWNHRHSMISFFSIKSIILSCLVACTWGWHWFYISRLRRHVPCIMHDHRSALDFECSDISEVITQRASKRRETRVQVDIEEKATERVHASGRHD
jgi:hypothetical protein